MQTHMTKRKTPDRAVPPVQEAAPSRSEMLHLSGAGAPQPMSPQLREKFEPGFGADFSNIRISRGHIPEEMGVQAVAQGTDILLDERAGMDVLGHELAHVVQQAQGRVAGGFPVVENAALEHEADVMGQRVSSGFTAQAGPQNGFGGEMMSISPMSAASAPAQCKSGKSKEEKKKDKMQISNPTAVQPGTAGYHNSMLNGAAAQRSKMSAASTHNVAISQMLDSMHDPAYMQRVMAHTGSSSEEIRTDMGKLVGADYARGALAADTHGADAASRDGAMFRASLMHHQNLSAFLQQELKQGGDQAVAAAKGSTVSEQLVDGKNEYQLAPGLIDAQFQALSDQALHSAPTMAAVDEFFGGMRRGGSDMSDEHLESIATSEIFLRGVNPLVIQPVAQSSPEEAQKLKIMSAGLQKKVKGNHVNLFPGRMSEAAPRRPDGTRVPQRGPAVDAKRAERAAKAADGSAPSTVGMREMFNESRAAAEAQQPEYEGLTRIFKDPKPAEAPPNYTGMKRMFDPEKAAYEAQMPGYEGVKRIFTEPKTPAQDAETTFEDMQCFFNPAIGPRREAQAAYRDVENQTFSGSMRSIFDEDAAELEELMPRAPGASGGDDIYSGLGIHDDLEDEEAKDMLPGVGNVSGAPQQAFLDPSYMRLLDSGPMGPIIGDEDVDMSVTSSPKKKSWWKFWK